MRTHGSSLLRSRSIATLTDAMASLLSSSSHHCHTLLHNTVLCTSLTCSRNTVYFIQLVIWNVYHAATPETIRFVIRLFERRKEWLTSTKLQEILIMSVAIVFTFMVISKDHAREIFYEECMLHFSCAYLCTTLCIHNYVRMWDAKPSNPVCMCNALMLLTCHCWFGK